MRVYRISSDAVALGVTEHGGQLDEVRFQLAHGTFMPMHTSPWLDEPHADDVPPMLRILRGDFFCAPFGDSDVLDDEPRAHGATANDHWAVAAHTDESVELELARPVMGADVRKRIHVRPGHAVVYQEHELVGGDGRIPIGHHAMLRADEPLRLGFSPKCWCGTPPTPVESDPARGHSELAYPQEFTSLSAVRRANGETVDLSTYPALDRHEDICMLVSDAAERFAWSAVTARDAGWVWFALKSPGVLPGTVLWMSNGGRAYPPFNGRHTGVLGIEEVAAFFHLGHRASTTPNFVSERGVQTSVTLRPDCTLCVRYLFGLAAAPRGFGRVKSIEPADGGIVLRDCHGAEAAAKVDTSFITG